MGNLVVKDYADTFEEEMDEILREKCQLSKEKGRHKKEIKNNPTMILFDIRKKLWQGFKIPWFIDWLIDYMLPSCCQVLNIKQKRNISWVRKDVKCETSYKKTGREWLLCFFLTAK